MANLPFRNPFFVPKAGSRRKYAILRDYDTKNLSPSKASGFHFTSSGKHNFRKVDKAPAEWL